MKKVLIIALAVGLLVSTPLIAEDNSALSNNSSTAINSSPNMNLSSTAVNVQQNNDSYTRMADIQCPNTTISLSGYGGKTSADNGLNNYDTDSDNYGLQGGVMIPVGDTVDRCNTAQEIHLEAMRFTATSKIIRTCMDMIQRGIQMSDQLKGTKEYEQFKTCDHFRIMQKENPTTYNNAVQQVNLAVQAPKKHVKVAKKLVGYKEYRIRFQNVKTCNTLCQGNISMKVKQIKSVKLDKENIFLVPYGSEGNISLYVRGNYLTKGKAEEQLMKYYEAGIPAKVVGVTGTEVYK